MKATDARGRVVPKATMVLQSVATLCGRLTAEESIAIVGAGCLRAGRKRDVISSDSVTSISPATPIPPEVEVRGSRCVAELLPRRTVCELDDRSNPHQYSRTWLY
jgi:hypothetical protein